MAQVAAKVALLATGDELVNGDVLNTNTQYIAKKLHNNNILPGVHFTVSDQQKEIEQAIRYLLTDHLVLITIGGLGPTSDDRTRFALSNALNLELIFDQASWQRIVALLSSKNLEITETNKQQCLFPKEAEIIANYNGTASACRISLGQQIIFMLPGPPDECYPIFDKVVLPYLLTKNIQVPLFQKFWLLLGVSESQIAEQLEQVKGNNEYFEIGYRVNRPYLEIKLKSSDHQHLISASEQFDKILSEQCISHKNQTASEQLHEFLLNSETVLSIIDKVTYGLLETALITPGLLHRIHIHHSHHLVDAQIRIVLIGLHEYWQNKEQASELNIRIVNGQHQQDIQKVIRYHKQLTPLYAREIICWEILKYLKNLKI